MICCNGALVEGPDGLVIDGQSGHLRWQPTVDQLGVHPITVELIDAYGLATQQRFDLQVNGTNTPPVFLSTPNTQAALNQAYTYQVIAQDPEQDALTYSLGINAAGITINPQTGLLQWTPQASQLGVHEIENPGSGYPRGREYSKPINWTWEQHL